MFLMLSSLVSSGFGFLFWIIAGGEYSEYEVGIATSLIASLSLLTTITRFGLNVSLVRFFPKGDRSRIFGTSLLVTTIPGLIIGMIFIIGIDLWSTELDIIKEIAPWFLIFMMGMSALSITSASFIASRRADLTFLQNILNGARVALLIPFTFLGTFGIFASYGISTSIVGMVSVAILIYMGVRPGMIDLQFVKDSMKYSAGNYLTGLFFTLPATLIPLIVLQVIGSEATAHYYIAFMFASILNIIPTATSTSLFVEGSHGEGLKLNAMKCAIMSFILLIPAVLVIYFEGDILLDMVGKSYTENGFSLLRIMIFSSFFFVIINMYLSIERVRNRMKELVAFAFLTAAGVLIPSYFLMDGYGIDGIGYAYLIGYGFVTMLILIRIKESLSLTDMKKYSMMAMRKLTFR